ncbi:MAG: cobalamin-dependent protein [Dehalococcoidales bacterium]|nr:cobalamin-dependent protein [Dehalococcoidales bacterium]
MLRILLINPPQSTRYPQPPIGLALIAAILEKEGHTVSLLDANALQLKPEDVAGAVSDAGVVGITAMTPTIGTALYIAHYLKRDRPGIKIILGGPHATLLPEETLNSSPDIDIIVRGEGDETVIDLMRAIEGGQPLDNIPGISYKADGKIVHTADRTSNVDMDSLPYPAYHLLPWKKYRPHPPHGMSMPFGAIVTSRGCPYRCAYCSKPVFGSRFRAQNPERVVEEMAFLHRKFGVKEIAFYDDSFTLDKERAHAIAGKIMEKGLKIAWTCETRVNLVDKELLRHMKQAGCYSVAYGIESASPQIIEVLHKDITLEQVEKAVRDSREVGLQVIGYFMLGSPGETPATIRKTIDYAKKLKVDFAQFSITTPFPGTELYDIYMRDKKANIPWEKFVYAGTDNPATPVFESSLLRRQDLQNWIRCAYREFYLRPSYVWQRLKRCTSWGEIRMNFRGLTMLLRSI